jgi:hypothetical protein
LKEIAALKPDVASETIAGPHLLAQCRPRQVVAALERFLCKIR